MAADLHIHVFEGITEGDLAAFFCHTFGSKYFDLTQRYSEEAFGIIAKTPNVHVGEVSWLKGQLFEDESYIPGPVQAVHALIGENLPVLDERLAEAIIDAMRSPNESIYPTGDIEKVREFLVEHMGKRLFTVSW